MNIARRKSHLDDEKKTIMVKNMYCKSYIKGLHECYAQEREW